MRITRKIEMTIATNSTYIIRKSSSSRKVVCPKCGEPMLTAEQAAGMFGITQRRVFRIVEAGAAHYTEADAGAVMICIKALQEFLGGEETLMPTNSGR